MDDKQLMDKIMERLSEDVREIVLNGMLYTLYMLLALTVFFTITGAMKAWGWL